MTIKRCYSVLVGATVRANQLVPDNYRNYKNTSLTDTRGISLRIQSGGSFASLPSPSSTGLYNVIVRVSFTSSTAVLKHNGASHDLTLAANISVTAEHTYMMSIKFDGIDTTTVNGLDAKNIQMFDLTAYFGSTIADYIYSLETATAGSGIAWLRTYGFITDDYKPYNAGSIESVEVTGKKVVGFNQWDEVWEVGGVNENTGADWATTDRIRSKNHVPVLPNTVYYIKAPSTIGTLAFYDADKNFISALTSISANYTRTTSANAWYIRFNMPASYGTTYNHDICINLSNTDRNGEYEAYTSQTYALGNDTLRGIFKLDASNNLYADGDVKTSDGVITRRYKKVTYDGSEAWVDYGSVRDNNLCFRIEPEGKVVGVQKSISDYGANINYAFAPDMPYKCYCDHGSFNMFYFRPPNDTITTLAAWKTYLASNPITVVYELATPTTEQSTPFTTPQIVYPDGTEEFVTENGVPVGHETKYQL